MKYTLLDLTQSILSSMDSDEINSINDSPESQQVVEVIKTVYEDIVSRGDLEKNKVLFNLVSSTDPLKPVMMTKPSNIDRVEWLKYNAMKIQDTTPDWVLLDFLPPQDFIQYIQEYNTYETYIDSFQYKSNTFTTTIVFRNDVAPHYYTVLEDDVVLFDSYDSGVDGTLQSSKTIGFGLRVSDFIKEDTYVPNLQPHQFPLLLNEAKSLAWAELKQTPHQKAEQTARRNWRHLQKTRRNIPDIGVFDSGAHPIDSFPNFSRRR